MYWWFVIGAAVVVIGELIQQNGWRHWAGFVGGAALITIGLIQLLIRLQRRKTRLYHDIHPEADDDVVDET